MILVILATMLAWVREARAQDTAIAYQGRLAVGGGGPPNPADRFDLRFRLYDAATGGNSLDEALAPTVATDTNGQFTVLLNASPIWSSSFAVQWVELGARRSGTTNDYTALLPRQRLTAVPKALHARQADVATSLTGLLSTANLPPNVARLDLPQVFTAPPVFSPPSGPPFTVGMTDTVQQLSADLLDGLDSAAFWRRGVSGVTESMGPNDPTSMLDLTLGTNRALRLQPGVPSPSLIGGSYANTVSSGLSGVTIAGGGSDSYPNTADSDNATIGGGTGNRIETGSDGSFIGSGVENSVGPFAFYAAIVGGAANQIRPQAQYSLIGGGVENLVNTQAYVSVIGGGQANRIEAARSALVGGIGNVIGPGSYEAFLGGGSSNKIQFNAPRSAILGGRNGLVRSNASYATVLGGLGSVAGGPFSIAAGNGAKAEHTGSIVLADGQYADFASSNANEFAVRAAGGVRFVTAGAGLFVDGQRLTSGGGGLVVPAGSVAASNLVDGAALAEILDDDGAGSGLDADRLDGFSSEDFWRVTGNAGTTAGVNFLGTTDNQAFELKVNNSRGFQILPAVTPNLVGGFSGNSVLGGVTGAHIGGGGEPGFPNAISDNYGTIGGGSGHAIQAGSRHATIAGGQRNTIESSAVFATIGGGSQHTIGISGVDGTIAGGSNNGIGHDALGATVSGGNLNYIQAGASSGTIGGGYQNLVQSTGASGTIPGGQQGRVANHGQMAYASGAFANAGDAQLSFYVLRRTLTTAGTNELFLDGDAATQRMNIPVEGTWTFDILVSARTDVGASAGYRITGVIRNNAGTTSFAGVPTQTIIAEDLAAWNVFVEADDTKDALVIKAAAVGTPTAATRWVATVRTTEVVF